MIFRKPDGVTLIELLLVLVMVAILGGLGMPFLRKGVENQDAKKALETLRAISQAVRLYELDKGSLASSLTPLTDIENAGYLNPNEYYKPQIFTYSINASANPHTIIATRTNPSRTITLTQSSVTGQDGIIVDSAGFLRSS